MITGENGILTQVENAKEENRAGAVEEAKDLWKTNQKADSLAGTQTAENLNNLLNRLVNQGLLTESEKQTVLRDGRVTIASRTIIFFDIEGGSNPPVDPPEGEGETTYQITIKPNGGKWQDSTENSTMTGSNGTSIIIQPPTREGYTFAGWTKEGSGSIENNTYTFGEGNGTIIAQWVEAIGLVPAVVYGNFNDGITTISVNNVDYEVRIINVYDEADGSKDNKIILSNQGQAEYEYVYGDTSDVATEQEDAKRMVIVKFHGDVEIEEGVTVRAIRSEDGFGGPKGMFLCSTGTIKNEGTITMTACGARAEGENVYLYSDKDTFAEGTYVPAVGGAGGAKEGFSSSSTSYGTAWRL